MKVLVACEFSGVVRDAFIKQGHDAVSCDLLPTEKAGPHIQDDVLKHLGEGWDLMIAHPPCTYLCVSGAAWFKVPERKQKQIDALNFVKALLNAPIKRICLENPVSIISSVIRKPDQIVQPWMFGDSYQKSTCLWLKNLPKLKPTKIVDKGEVIIHKSGKKKPKWFADAFKLPPEERRKERSRTFQGIAQAMAEQWGNYKPLQIELTSVGGKT